MGNRLRDLSFSQGIGIFALISLICGIALSGASIWPLQMAVEAYQSPKIPTPFDLVSQVGLLFSGAEPLYPQGGLTTLYIIVISNTSIIFIASLAQCAISAFVLSSKRSSNQLSTILIYSNILLAILILFPSICLIYNELSTTSVSIVVLLGVAFANLIFLLISTTTMVLIAKYYANIDSFVLELHETSL